MSVEYRCDNPKCLWTGGLAAPARVTALTTGLRARHNPAESPVVYLPPVGWVDVTLSNGTRMHACSIVCRDAIVGAAGADPQGPPRECAACGQVLSEAMPRGALARIYFWGSVTDLASDVAPLLKTEADERHFLDQLRTKTTITRAAEPELDPAMMSVVELDTIRLRWEVGDRRHDDVMRLFAHINAQAVWLRRLEAS